MLDTPGSSTRSRLSPRRCHSTCPATSRCEGSSGRSYWRNRGLAGRGSLSQGPGPTETAGSHSGASGSPQLLVCADDFLPSALGPRSRRKPSLVRANRQQGRLYEMPGVNQQEPVAAAPRNDTVVAAQFDPPVPGRRVLLESFVKGDGSDSKRGAPMPQALRSSTYPRTGPTERSPSVSRAWMRSAPRGRAPGNGR